MKVCSKCRRDLPRDQFVKSPRYLDGLYPSCKTCRKRVRDDFLKRKPLCRNCNRVPHIPTSPFCDDCMRKSCGRGPAKWRQRRSGFDTCPKCLKNPRLKYHRYCRRCKNAASNLWVKKNGGSWKAKTPEQRRKAVARRYINTQVQRGKVKRGFCPHCGKQADEFHHFDYKDRTLNGIWVCHHYHVLLERQKRTVDKTGQLELLL